MLRNFLDPGIDPNFTQGLLSQINAMQMPVAPKVAPVAPHVANIQARDQMAAQMVNQLAQPQQPSQPQMQQAPQAQPPQAPEMQQPAQPAEQPGLLSQIFTPENLNMLGSGLYAVMRGDKDVLGTAMASAKQFKQQQALQSFTKAIQNSPMLKTQAQKDMLSSLIATGDPKAIEYAMNAVKPPADYTLSAGGQRFSGETNQELAHGAPALTTLEQNIEAATGAKPGTPEFQRAMAQATTGGGRGLGGVDLQNLTTARNEIKRINPNLTPQQIDDAVNAYSSGNNTLSDGTTLAPSTSILNGAMNRMYKRETDLAQRSQERFAATLETTFKQADPLMPSVVKYTGVKGKAKYYADAAKAQNGKFDPDYSNYLKFTRQIIPGMVSEILRTGGANSTDTQKLLAIQQTDPIALDNNPDLAMEQYKFLKDMYSNIAKTVSQGPSKTHQQLQDNNNQDSAGSSQDQIKTYEQQAADAIKAGKDPVAVNQLLQQLRGY